MPKIELTREFTYYISHLTREYTYYTSHLTREFTYYELYLAILLLPLSRNDKAKYKK